MAPFCRFLWSVFLTALVTSTARADGACALASEPTNVADFVNPDTVQPVAGSDLKLTWERPQFEGGTCEGSVWLVLATAHEARFSGDGFMALASGEPTLQDLEFAADRTRLFIPLPAIADHRGTITITPFVISAFEIDWALFHQSEAERAARISPAMIVDGHLDLAVEPGRPRVVGQDLFSTQTPLERIRSNSGRFILEVFDGHYRVNDALSGALIHAGYGYQPNFSPTSRFLNVLGQEIDLGLGDPVFDDLTVIDLFSEQVVLRTATPGRQFLISPHWSRGDSFLVISAATRGEIGFEEMLTDRPVKFHGSTFARQNTAEETGFVDIDLDAATARIGHGRSGESLFAPPLTISLLGPKGPQSAESDTDPSKPEGWRMDLGSASGRSWRRYAEWSDGPLRARMREWSDRSSAMASTIRWSLFRSPPTAAMSLLRRSTAAFRFFRQKVTIRFWKVVTSATRSIFDRDFQFDGTPEGARHAHLKFYGDRYLYSLDQFADRLRCPGLMPSRLATSGEAAYPSPGEAPSPVPLLPWIEQVDGGLGDAVDGGAAELWVRVHARSGLRSIALYRDGSAIERRKGEGKELSELVFDLKPLPETRSFALLATDSDGVRSQAWVQSSSSPLGSRPSGRLVAMALGSDRYDDPAIPNLRFAVSDARSMVDRLGNAKSPYYSSIETHLVVDAVDLVGEIRDRLHAIVSGSSEKDTLFLHVAGHGVLGVDGQLYLAGGRTRLGDLAGTAVAWREIVSILERSRGRVVVFLDVCHSGAAGGATNDAAVDDLAVASGAPIVVLATSKGRQYGLESVAFGGGLFTSALLDVLLEEPHDQQAPVVGDLFQTFSALKPRVVDGLGGEQTPGSYGAEWSDRFHSSDRSYPKSEKATLLPGRSRHSTADRD